MMADAVGLFFVNTVIAGLALWAAMIACFAIAFWALTSRRVRRWENGGRFFGALLIAVCLSFSACHCDEIDCYNGPEPTYTISDSFGHEWTRCTHLYATSYNCTFRKADGKQAIVNGWYSVVETGKEHAQ